MQNVVVIIQNFNNRFFLILWKSLYMDSVPQSQKSQLLKSPKTTKVKWDFFIICYLFFYACDPFSLKNTGPVAVDTAKEVQDAISQFRNELEVFQLKQVCLCALLKHIHYKHFYSIWCESSEILTDFNICSNDEPQSINRLKNHPRIRILFLEKC